MLIDMDAPGVEVRPITMISGTSPFCETFFTDVKVPKENLVGKEGQGWTIGKRLLQHERTNISGGGRLAGMMGQSLADVAKKYCETGSDGALVNKVLRDKIADLEIRWNSFLLTARRAVEESKAQGGVSEISSVLKKLESEGVKFEGADAVDASVLTDPAEQALIRLLAAFPAEITAAAEKYDPARITRYCIDVASAYHRFYNACRILDAEGSVQQGRIALCLAVRGVIHNILTMFKVNAPETM